MYDDLKYLSVELPEDIMRLKCSGDFEGMLEVMDMRLGKDIPKALRKRLELERYIVDILKKRYTYTFEAAADLMRKKVRGFKDEELRRLQYEGAVEWIMMNGQVMYIDSFFDNIIKTRPDIAARCAKDQELHGDGSEKNILDDNMEQMKQNGKAAYRICLHTSIEINESSWESDKKLRVHLPLPIDCMQTRNIKILASSPEPKYISAAAYPQRTAYFEANSSETRKFALKYEYENHVRYISPEPSEADGIQPAFDTGEKAPHIMFTPYIRELTAEVIGSETNPVVKARRIYDFITTKVMYSYMRSYLAITNIPEYASLNLKGDCGVQALLFITMCRCTGIPARWQSGLYVIPGHAGCHDWAQFYISPYGWLFADPSFGGSAYRAGALERWDYYFGNLDPFRMPAASEYQHEFDPPKKYMRQDPYDNQTGEAEYEDRRLDSSDFTEEMQVVEMEKIE